MTVSFVTSTFGGSTGLWAGAPHMSDVLLDRDSDERTVFGPGAVVVLDVLVAKQLVQGEPGVAGPLADTAVGDRVLPVVEAGGAIERTQLVVRLERAVFVSRLAPRDVDCGRDVPGPLSLLLREMSRSQEPAGELVRGPHIDQILDADCVDRLVAECTDRGVLIGRGVRGRRPLDGLLGQLPSVELPLLATAVEQLHVLVPVQLEIPVRVRREPVVVTAIEHHGVVVADTAFAEQLLELFFADEVPADLVLQVGLPVQLHGTGDVTTVIRRSVFVDLDEDHSGGG